MYREPGYYYKRATHVQLMEANNDAHTHLYDLYIALKGKYDELR
jgi:hypothetical protein